MLENIFYVYVHKTLDTHEVFYVGKGKRNRIGSKKDRNDYWKNIVNKHGYYSEKIIENLTEESAYIQEILAIKHYKPKANFLPGGTGGDSKVSKENFVRDSSLKNRVGLANRENYKNNPQRAIKQAENSKKRWEDPEYKKRVGNKISLTLKNLPITEEKKILAENARKFITKDSIIKRGFSISKANKGKKKPPRTAEHCKKLSDAKMGIKHRAESMLKSAITKGSKPFEVFTQNNELVGEWINRAQCGRDLNLNPNLIGCCLKGKRKSHKRLIFKYKI